MLTIKNQPRKLQFGRFNHHAQQLSAAFSLGTLNPFNLFLVVLPLLLVCGCTPAGPKALLQGEKLVEKGKFTQAIEKLKLATTLIPTNAQAWNYLGLAHHYARQPDDAEKSYRRSLLINHDLSEAHYNLGCLYLEQRKNDAAKTEFFAYTLRRANSLEALLKLGTAQLRLNEISPAEKTFQDALRLGSQNPQALNGLGCVRARQRGRANEAANCFRAALKSQTNYPPALLNLAILAQQQLQDKRYALQVYREYTALKPPPENVQAVKAVALQLEQELNPQVPTVSPVPTIANIANQRPPTNAARPAGTHQPDSANPPNKAPASSTKVATNNSKPPPAVAQPFSAKTDIVQLAPEPQIKTAQETPLNSTSPQSSGPDGESPVAPSANRVQAERLFADGRSAQQAHRLTDAINSYRAATQQDPTYFDAFFNLAVGLAESGNVPGAISTYESALAVKPDSQDARYNLALLLKQNNEFTRAAAELEKLLEKYPNDTRSHLSLGNLYAQQLHDPAKARQHYLKVLESDPHNPQASSIRFWLTSNP